jgi:hypothetical protein
MVQTPDIIGANMNKSRALHNGRLHGRLAGIAGLPQAIAPHR